MRQLFPQVAIYPCSGDGTRQRNRNDRGPRANLGEKRPRASAGGCPAETKDQPAVDLALAELLGRNIDRVSVKGPDLEFLDQQTRQSSDQYSAADDPVHKIERASSRERLCQSV